MKIGVISKYIAEDLEIAEAFIENTIELFENGATVHFISRYRKEGTGGLDEVKIKNISERLEYYRELGKRKEVILRTVREQGKLTGELEKKIVECREKQKIEDLYLPYKPKRRTKATMAKEKGLEPLADIILFQPAVQGSKQDIVLKYIDCQKGVETYEEAVTGAIDIVAEKIAENAEIRSMLREHALYKGALVSSAQKKWKNKKSKYEMYYGLSEPMKKAPSHHILAIRRGAKEDVLSWKIEGDENKVFSMIESRIIRNRQALFAEELVRAIQISYKRLLSASIEIEVFLKKIQDAEKEAINVFSKNLRNLLLSPPIGHKSIIGIDPGFKAGCKVAVIDGNGVFKEYQQIFPRPGENANYEAEKILLFFIKKYSVEIVAIGNGTASKETNIFVKRFIEKNNLKVYSLVVNESGASVYSASETARKEFPNLDVLVRGAISIARRVQDPLSELVKIDPKSIGVGQYQHDVNQHELKKALNFVVESCVNYVGVNLNIASCELLSYVSGIGEVIAGNIVKYRAQQGYFKDKKELLNVPRLGDKVFQQCAGFLRIFKGNNPLDNSAIHPEHYHIVEKMAEDRGVDIQKLIGNEALAATIKLSDYAGEGVGIMTLQDIEKELNKPGLDPRKDFVFVQHSLDVNDIKDVQIDMELEGTVTNVTNFGAFVDIGVHQDGLIHISRLSDSFVKSPHDVIAVGDTVRVKVISVDKELKRIGLEKMPEFSKIDNINKGKTL